MLYRNKGEDSFQIIHKTAMPDRHSCGKKNRFLKKVSVFFMFVFVLLIIISCSRQRSITGADLLGGYTNTGRIKAHTLNLYNGYNITETDNFYYDNNGRIMAQKSEISGSAAVYIYLRYNPAGQVESGLDSSTGSGKYFIYDSSNRLSIYYETESQSVTTTAYFLSYDTDNNISGIDNYYKGTYKSHRDITRDAAGYIVSEKCYDELGNNFGNVTYARNDTNKTITVSFYMWSYLEYTLTVTYDSSGFWNGNTCLFSNGDTYYTETNQLQAGLFDAGGVRGYYYTDKDLYFLYPFFSTSIGFDTGLGI